jgi:hypothetical protein
MSQSKVVSVKRWGSRLNSKPSAQELRKKCEKLLTDNSVLVINMAGVRDITPGFAQECFGKLHLEANKRGARIKFQHTEKTLAPILLNGIKAELR